MTQPEQKKKTNSDTPKLKADPEIIVSECFEFVSVVLAYSRRRWSHSMTTSEIPYSPRVEANAVERYSKVKVVSLSLHLIIDD